MFKLLKKLLLLFFRNTNSCFYMNSANILPPPLDEEEEYNMLIAFKRFYNGKVGSYSSYGGDNRLKEIAKITRGYSDAIKYLGMDNNRFKELVFMNIDKGEELLKNIIHEDILEII